MYIEGLQLAQRTNAFAAKPHLHYQALANFVWIYCSETTNTHTVKRSFKCISCTYFEAYLSFS